jgi:hypothetical protein
VSDYPVSLRPLLVKFPFEESLESSGFDHQTEKNLQWRDFNTQVIDLGSLKSNVK